MSDRLKNKRPGVRAFKAGFMNSLGEAVSIVGVRREFPRVEQDPSKALAGDWKRLGGDMRRAVEHAAPRGSSKR